MWPSESETVMAPDFAALSAMQRAQTGETKKWCVRCTQDDGEDDYAYTHDHPHSHANAWRATVAPPVDNETHRHR